MPDAPTTIHLVDASPYVFRAYFSLPASIVDPAGRPVNAVHGFASFLVKLATGEHPTHLALAFDRSLTTSFRNELYPAYKSGRALPPEDLEAQIGACEELGAAFGAAVLADERYEADDLVATLRERLRGDARRFVVVSNDKDLAQLVDHDTEYLDFAKGVRLDPAAVRGKFGVDPAQVPDLLGLAGDAVDAIPGVPGVGAKSAVALLRRFGTLDAVYGDLDAVEELPVRGAASLRRKLEQHRDQAFLSRTLATVARDAPVRERLRDVRWKGPDAARVAALFDRLGIGKLRERVLACAP